LEGRAPASTTSRSNVVAAACIRRLAESIPRSPSLDGFDLAATGVAVLANNRRAEKGVGGNSARGRAHSLVI